MPDDDSNGPNDGLPRRLDRRTLGLLLPLLVLTTSPACVEFRASARMHGISDDDIRHAVENPRAGGRSDDEIGFAMLVGTDQAGNLIEVGIVGIVGIVVTDDIEYAIHAMRARNRYLDWL